MSVLDKLKDIISPIDDVVSGFREIIAGFKLAPEEKQKAEIEILKLRLDAERSTREAAIELDKLYLADAANLREQAKVELTSQDPFVRRSRPAWMWGLLLIYVTNYGITACVNWFHPVEPVEIPELVHGLTMALVVGYQYFRTLEKTGGKVPLSK